MSDIGGNPQLNKITNHVVTILASRLAVIIGTPALTFLAWLLFTEIRTINSNQHQFNIDLQLLQAQINHTTGRVHQHETNSFIHYPTRRGQLNEPVDP